MAVSKTTMPKPDSALPGRPEKMVVSDKHSVNSNKVIPPFPAHTKMAILGMGCFWGAERKFWQTEGVYSTQVGYMGGFTPNPTYEEVCSGDTGHAEVVRVIYDPKILSYDQLLNIFWENHDPTQSMKQGPTIGTQYRSVLFYFNQEQKHLIDDSLKAYQHELTKQGYGEIMTEVLEVSEFFYAEDYHQQYLFKNPDGYCGLGGTGVSCPRGSNL